MIEGTKNVSENVYNILNNETTSGLVSHNLLNRNIPDSPS